MANRNHSISRRAALSAGLAAAIVATVPALAAGAPDAKLRALWAEYQERVRPYVAAKELVEATRDAVRKDGEPRPAYKAWCQAGEHLWETVEKIYDTPAESLFGITSDQQGSEANPEGGERAIVFYIRCPAPMRGAR